MVAHLAAPAYSVTGLGSTWWFPHTRRLGDIQRDTGPRGVWGQSLFTGRAGQNVVRGTEYSMGVPQGGSLCQASIYPPREVLLDLTAWMVTGS